MKKLFAFTLAEVLITLGIIGVVAAMTLPTVIANYQKQQTVAKLKKSYSILVQVMQKSVADNSSAELGAGDVLYASKVKDFFQTYWFPYFNSPNIYKGALGTDFYSFRNGNPTGVEIFTSYDFGRVFFTTQDGVAYFVNLMTWSGNKDSEEGLGQALFASKQTVYIDINGMKKPNMFGKDVFVFEIDFQNGIVRPGGNNSSEFAINNSCSKSGDGISCAAKILRDGWKIKNDYPW